MSSTLWLTAVSVFAPLLAFAIIVLFLRVRHRPASLLSVGLAGLAMAASWAVFFQLYDQPQPTLFEVAWLRAEAALGLSLKFGFLLDELNLLTLVIVTTVHFLIQLYSLGYMKGDPGMARYFACLSLFGWSMMGLVTSANLIQVFVFWELVGLTSYLLIGFWYEKLTASQAGKKAFVMTRLGDIGFFLGFIVILASIWHDPAAATAAPGAAQQYSLSILQVQDAGFLTAHMSPGLITAAGLLMFFGICGKSAQFPLHSWLPDAMEGPTPVSALLHSATMVAAGVYLLARLYGLFVASEVTLQTVLFIGTLTTLLASTMAMVARDIKRVLAYSTVSQLGFMIMGLAAAGLLLNAGQESNGIFPGMFHLTTHAGFKAMLFLAAGAFIHHYGTNDMFEIGRLGGRSLKVALVALLVGGAALSGVPLFSGFFSKEAIITEMGHMTSALGAYTPYLVCAYIAAFLTPYYTFRMVFAVWTPAPGQPTGGDEGPAGEHGDVDGHDDAAGHEAHEGHGVPLVMATSLIVLIAATLVLGWLMPQLAGFLGVHEAPHGFFEMLAHGWLAVLVVALGIGVAWWEFGRKASPRRGFIYKVQPLATLFERKWYVDEAYRWLVDKVVMRVASLAYQNDNKVVDGASDGLANGTVSWGRSLSERQLGQVQYSLAIVFVVVVVIVYFVGLY